MHQPVMLLLDSKGAHASWKGQILIASALGQRSSWSMSFPSYKNNTLPHRSLSCQSPTEIQTFHDIRHGCRSLLQRSTWSLVDQMNRHSNKLPSSKTNHSMDTRRNHFWFWEFHPFLAESAEVFTHFCTLWFDYDYQHSWEQTDH